MSRKNNAYETEYLKGNIRINPRVLFFFVSVIALFLVGALLGSAMRHSHITEDMDNQLKKLRDDNRVEIVKYIGAIESADLKTEPSKCNYPPCGDKYVFLDSRPALDFDYFLREKFSFDKAGFTARIIFRHKVNGYMYFGPGVREYKKLDWEMAYFEPCLQPLLDKGVCHLSPEEKRSENVYAYLPLRDAKGRVIAVLLGALIQSHSGFGD